MSQSTVLSGEQIRILELLPSETRGSAAPLLGNVHIQALSNNPDYETVSYVWGDPELSMNMKVDGYDIKISPNLDALLRKLRHSNQTRHIWADQVCIDQSNLAEKTAQVRMMGDIYSNCRRCFIWMGEIPKSVSFSEVDDVFHLLDYMAQPDTVQVPLCLESRETMKNVLKALFLIHPNENIWWKRIWTVQEVILPPRKTILWGPKALTWEHLHQAIYTITTRYLPALMELLDEKDLQTMNDLCANVVWITHGREIDLPSIMATKWRSREATNLRDKVFGLLGLVPDEEFLEFTNKCTYESPEATIYSSFTLDAIVAKDSLQPLLLNPRLEDGNATKGVPRWAMDLKASPQFGADPFYRDWAHGFYKACNGMDLNQSLLRSTIAENAGSTHVLGITGFMVDEVDVISPDQCTQPHSDAEISEKLKAWLSLATNYRSKKSPATNSLNINEEFCRLFAADIFEPPEGESEPRVPNKEDLERLWAFIQEGERNEGEIWIKESHMRSQLFNQAFFITKSGKLGMGPRDTQREDQVWIFSGGNYPFTIRPGFCGDSGNHCDFVGCCYVQGIMFGEAFHDRKRSLTETQTIYLH